MLQIRLSKNPSSEGGGGAKHLPVDSVTVACPDHLVLADLPVAKGLGSATAASVVKNVGRRSRRQLGERVHFCVRCDFPIAIYGRLSPCEHAFCLDCARSDSMCYLCDERIQKIQTIKMMEGIFVCAAPHCLKSFLKRVEFESHIHESHVDLLHLNTEKDGYGSETGYVKKTPTGSDSTVQGASRPIFSPGSNFQLQDREDKTHRPLHRDQPTTWPPMQQKPVSAYSGIVQNHSPEPQADSRPPGFDRPGAHNQFPPQNSESLGGPQLETNQFPEYPMHTLQPPNYIMPMNPHQFLAPPLNYPPFPPEGVQPFVGAPYEMARLDSVSDVGGEQGSLLGFQPSPAGSMNLPENYPRPWNNITGGMPFESSGTGRAREGFSGMSDSQGRAAFFHTDYGRSPGVLPSNLPLPSPANKAMEPAQGISVVDPRDAKGVLAPQPVQLPPPPPPPVPHMSQLKRGLLYSGEMGQEGQSYGWQHDRNDSFGSGQD